MIRLHDKIVLSYSVHYIDWLHPAQTDGGREGGIRYGFDAQRFQR